MLTLLAKICGLEDKLEEFPELEVLALDVLELEVPALTLVGKAWPPII